MIFNLSIRYLHDFYRFYCAIFLSRFLKLTTLAFTLIELLAVIVILAIIALIAVPIVIHIIDDSKKSSEKESIKLYLDTVEKMVAKYQMNHTSFDPNICAINNKKIRSCIIEAIKFSLKICGFETY